MPGKHGFRLDDQEGIPPVRQPTAQPEPQKSIRFSQARALLGRPLQNRELVTKSQDFCRQHSTCPEATTQVVIKEIKILPMAAERSIPNRQVQRFQAIRNYWQGQAGYSAFFVHLTKSVQDEIIRRTEVESPG
jgi:hypothetical protein